MNPTSKARGPSRYLPQLDGLRAIAVLAVVAFHAHIPIAVGGYLGVDLFFVLSGFLITSILSRELERDGKIRLRAFYGKRILRLLPALVVLCVVVGTLWLIIPGAPERSQTLWGIPTALTYSSNWVRAFDASSLAFMGHTWSLSVEEHFYLVWPIVLIAAVKLTGRLKESVVFLCCIAILYRILAGTAFDWSLIRLYNGSDTQATQLLIGCMLAVTIRQGAWFAKLWPALAASAIVVCALIIMPQHSQFYRAGASIFVALAVAVLVAHVVTHSNGRMSKLLSSAALVWIGKRSYGIYLWHYPILGLAAATATAMPLWLSAVVGAVLSFIVPAISYRFVEAPFLVMKKRFDVPEYDKHSHQRINRA